MGMIVLDLVPYLSIPRVHGPYTWGRGKARYRLLSIVKFHLRWGCAVKWAKSRSARKLETQVLDPTTKGNFGGYAVVNRDFSPSRHSACFVVKSLRFVDLPRVAT
jgi:hypothetical protein